MTIARPSDSESSTCGRCGSTSSSFKFQLSIQAALYIRRIEGETYAQAMVIAIDGPAGAGKSTVAQRRGEGTRFHIPGFRGDVPRRRSGSLGSRQ